jgi:spore photoproduct lyase
MKTKPYPNQLNLFKEHQKHIILPVDYTPVRPEYFDVSRIFLAKGSRTTPERRIFVERIIEMYPGVEIVDCPDTPHNRIKLDEKDTLELHRVGKKTLVFGELKSAVRFSKEDGNTCPNYWHFSPYGFCPFNCKYCYLAGTQGVKFSPTVKIYVNLPEILYEVDRISLRLGKPTSFYIGKLQDPLALDPLTAYSGSMISFFAKHPFARMTLLTKSNNVDRLLNIEHGGNTILSWSVNPPDINKEFEENVPGMNERLEAMNRVASAGYPVRAVIMPMIPVDEWNKIYKEFTVRLLKDIPIQRLTIGGICIYQGALHLMEHKLGKQNPISSSIENNIGKIGDGRVRYSRELREDIYSTIIGAARQVRPDLEIALCLEEMQVWKNLGLLRNLGQCNCVL